MRRLTPSSSHGLRLCSAGTILFGISLWLPAVDTDFGELVRGANVRGYQCALGLALMPLTAPLASPLWLTLLAGNVWSAMAPLALSLVRAPESLARRARWLAGASLLVALALAAAGERLGLTALHSGFAVWIAALALTFAGTWSVARRRGRLTEL